MIGRFTTGSSGLGWLAVMGRSLGALTACHHDGLPRRMRSFHQIH